MANNRNPYYKVYVGDELRLQKMLSTDAYGLYGIIRNWVHDSDPYAHLVDAHGQPLTDEALIDLSGLKASAFRAAFNDLLALKAVWESRFWLAEIEQKQHKKYIEIARELVVGVRRLAVVGSALEATRDRDPLLVPALADQWVRATHGRRTGPRRGREDVRGDLGGDVRSPLRSHVGGDPHAHIHDTEHDYESLGSLSVLTPGQKEKKTSTTRAGSTALRTQPATPPWSWEKHLYLCDQVAKLDADLKARRPEVLDDEAAYAAHFLGKLQIEFAVFRQARDFWQHGPQSTRPVPEPCLDGHHVRDAVTGRCRYCPAIVEVGS